MPITEQISRNFPRFVGIILNLSELSKICQNYPGFVGNFLDLSEFSFLPWVLTIAKEFVKLVTPYQRVEDKEDDRVPEG